MSCGTAGGEGSGSDGSGPDVRVDGGPGSGSDGRSDGGPGSRPDRRADSGGGAGGAGGAAGEARRHGSGGGAHAALGAGVPPEAVDPDVDLHVPAQRAETAGRGAWRVLAVVAAGGAAGAVARYGLTLAWPVPEGGFPWAILVVNVTGCALIGVLMVLVSERPADTAPGAGAPAGEGGELSEPQFFSASRHPAPEPSAPRSSAPGPSAPQQPAPPRALSPSVDGRAARGGRSGDGPHPLWRPFLGTGVLGGFTTFSTYAVDLRTLLLQGAPGAAAAYAAGTLLAALAAVWAAALLTRDAVRRYEAVAARRRGVLGAR